MSKTSIHHPTSFNIYQPQTLHPPKQFPIKCNIQVTGGVLWWLWSHPIAPGHFIGLGIAGSERSGATLHKELQSTPNASISICRFLFESSPCCTLGTWQLNKDPHLPTTDPACPQDNPLYPPYKMQHPGDRWGIVMNLKSYSWNWAFHTHPNIPKMVKIPNRSLDIPCPLTLSHQNDMYGLQTCTFSLVCQVSLQQACLEISSISSCKVGCN